MSREQVNLVPRSQSVRKFRNYREGSGYGSSLSSLLSSTVLFRAEKRKKHARTLSEGWTPKVSKMAAILIFLFSTIYYATVDISVSSDNYPTQ